MRGSETKMATDKSTTVGLDEEKQNSEPREPSIVTSSTANDIETPEVRHADTNNDQEKGMNEAEKPVEYPKGLEMFFIMLALVLSITLCSLDQVSSTVSLICCY
jgi:MFS transporter, DHA2 family, glioxin efflux transporter